MIMMKHYDDSSAFPFFVSKRLSFLVMRELQMDSIYKGIEPAIAALIAIA
jgi:hypothetical protein